MSNSKILLISANPEDQVFITQLAATCGLTFITVPDVKEGVNHIAHDDICASFIDVTEEASFLEFESEVQNQLGLFSDKVNTNRFHYISSRDLDGVKYLCNSTLFGNFLLRNYTTPLKAKIAAERYAPVVKASLMDRAFGLKNFFSDKAQIQNIRVLHSNQKQKIVEAIRGFLIKARYPTRVATVIANAVDELVMNGIFAAPIDEVGHRVYEQTPRDTPIELVGQAIIDVTLCVDGSRCGISISDNFGSIDKEKIIRHLSTVYTRESYTVKTNVAGAGIGLATTFRNAGSLIFICEKGSRTEVAVTYERYENFKDFKGQFRYIATQFYY